MSVTSPVCLVDLVCFVYLVDLVHLVCLVSLVYLVSLVQPNKRDKPNRPDKPNNDLRMLVDFSSILLDQRVSLVAEQFPIGQALFLRRPWKMSVRIR